MNKWLLIGLFGAAGTLSRFGVGLILAPWLTDYYWHTFVVNGVGTTSLVLIVLLLPLPTTSIREAWQSGFLGAFTTFSAFGIEVVQLLDQQRLLEAILYGISTSLITIGICGSKYLKERAK